MDAALALPHRLLLASTSTSANHALHHPKTPFNLFIRPSSNPPHLLRATSQQRETLQSLSGVVTDRNVPEGHKGLHGFLYGDGDGEVHGDGGLEELGFVGIAGQDDGLLIMPWNEYVLPRETAKFAGVYAVYDEAGAPQYVGYSRHVVLSLKAHRGRVGDAKCASVRVRVFHEATMISRARFEEERSRWLEGFGTLPPGNADERGLWEGSGAGVVELKSMSDEERNEYEEKKLKMRKAMGENLADDVEGEDDDARTRRMKLLKAMEGDDWSSVIDGQTKETLGTDEALENSVATEQNQDQAITGEKFETLEVLSSQIISPFAKPDTQQNGALYSAQTYEFTLENVDLVLNEVRPYLIADGGNVEVVSAVDGVVSLRLQGACGTCPSSTSTMKMGIERVLKEKFGDILKDVVQIDPHMVEATVGGINAHLDMLRPAIHNYGGMIEVVSVDVSSGRCEVKYKGPAPLGSGIQAAIKDKFPDVKEVIFLD